MTFRFDDRASDVEWVDSVANWLNLRNLGHFTSIHSSNKVDALTLMGMFKLR